MPKMIYNVHIVIFFSIVFFEFKILLNSKYVLKNLYRLVHNESNKKKNGPVFISLGHK